MTQTHSLVNYVKSRELSELLETGAQSDRDARVRAAKEPPLPWQPMSSVPRDGTLIDVRFSTTDAEPGMAEYYAPGCTRPGSSVEPVIENVAFINGSFKGVVDAEAARAVEQLKGGYGAVTGVTYGILSVTLDGWRPAAYPHIE